MTYPFQIKKFDGVITPGKVEWQCPSNIAIVKYWGKHGRQLPKNASISFTLTNAHTNTAIEYSDSKSGSLEIDFLFEGKENQPFKLKLEKYLQSIVEFVPLLSRLKLSISSSNSFPHSSGIASSASAMGAIAACICDIESIITKEAENTPDTLIKKASYLARLGSGSASRSLLPKLGEWGLHPAIEDSSDLYANSLHDVHEVFNTFHDDILIVSAAEKSVSSTAGHALMNDNIYAESRYKQANDRVTELYTYLKSGDVDSFGKLAEDEAMTLHALMMCSDPSYVLMEPGTLDMIREIRLFRSISRLPVYFTLDAGPNIHLLYPDHIKKEVKQFIHEKLMQYTADGIIIEDIVGNGPKKFQ